MRHSPLHELIDVVQEVLRTETPCMKALLYVYRQVLHQLIDVDESLPLELVNLREFKEGGFL